MARLNSFEILGRLCVVTGVFGEAGVRIFLHYNPNCATKVAVAETLGIQSDQVMLFKAMVLLLEYGAYVAAIGLPLVFLGKLLR